MVSVDGANVVVPFGPTWMVLPPPSKLLGGLLDDELLHESVSAPKSRPHRASAGAEEVFRMGSAYSRPNVEWARQTPATAVCALAMDKRRIEATHDAKREAGRKALVTYL